MNATGDEKGAGIGFGADSSGNSIIINNGTIIAVGGSNGAGIGGGMQASGGSITINAGKVRATGGNCGAGIGGGSGASSGTIKINGGEVRATGGNLGAGIGGGGNGSGDQLKFYGGTVNATGGNCGAGIGGGAWGSGGEVRIKAGVVTAQTDGSSDNNSQAIGHGSAGDKSSGLLSVYGMRIYDSASAETPVTASRSIEVCRSAYARVEQCSPHVFENDVCQYCGIYTGGISYVDASGKPQICSNYFILKSSDTQLDGSWYAATEDIDFGDNRLKIISKVNLILCDGVTLTFPKGIHIRNTGDLTIWQQSGGTGKLNVVRPDENNAGIGGNEGQHSGNITINGGNVTSSGGKNAAGIGGGVRGYGSVTINGGNVTSSGGENAAGIGGGGKGDGGTIKINGGEVHATGGKNGAGIGGGEKGDGGTVKISGGEVHATGGKYGAGIGGGKSGKGGTTTIRGGKVHATGGRHGAGIGSGEERAQLHPLSMGRVTISGGEVHATGGFKGGGIGFGLVNNAKEGSITITGGKVNIISRKAVSEEYRGVTNLTLGLSGEDDYINAGHFYPKTVTLLTPMHYSLNGNDTGPVTTTNLSEKAANAIIVPGKSDAGVSISEGDLNITYGEGVISLTGNTKRKSTDGVWTWTSSDPDVAEVTGYGASAQVKITGIGTATVTAAYSSDIIEGSASVKITVDKAADKALPQVIRSADYRGTGISVDLKDVLPNDIGDIESYKLNGDASSAGSVTVSDPAVSAEGVVTAAFSGGAEGDTITIPVLVTANHYNCTVEVVVNLVTLPPVRHSVNIADCDGGTVTADRQTAYEGESVLLTVTPDYGSYLESLTVTYGSGQTIEVTDDCFLMPDSDVTVTVKFTTRFTYNWESHALTLISGEFDNNENWGGLIHPSDVLSVTAKSGVRFVGDCSEMFRSFDRCTSIDLSEVDTSAVTDMNSMFYGCSALETLNISGWDTSAVTDMNSMFYGCSALETLNISGWDASHVRNMFAMFMFCESLGELKLNGLVTSSTTNLNHMFDGCKSLTTLEMNGWDTSGVEETDSMFAYCESLKSIDIRGLNTSAVTYMPSMFAYCSSLKEMDLRGLDLSNVTSVDSLFAGCSSLTSVDLSDVRFTNAYSLDGMFSGCVKLSDVRLNGCNMPEVSEMDAMFMDCASLTSIDLSGLGAAKVYSTSRMFKGCTYLESVSVNGWYTSGLVDVHEMFADCESLSEIDLSQTDLSSVEIANGMFSGCTNLESAKLSAFSAWVSELDGMFSKCTSLKTVELSVNATENKPTAMEMFEDCTSLEELDLSALQGELADTSLMFSGCTALTALDLSGALIAASGDEAAYTEEMFSGCGLLRALTVSPGTAITEEMCLNNGNPLESGWIVKGDDTMSVISGNGETAVIPAPAEKIAYVWKNSDLSRFAGHSLSLNGDIGLNFFIRLTEEEAAYATVDFTWTVDGEEKTATVYMSDAEKTDHGYKATCHIAPAEMTYQITAAIELDGKEYTDTYAAVDYADVILTDSDFASKYVAAENAIGKDGDKRLNDLRYLIKTMLDYGAKAQIQFERDSEVELANKKLVVDDQNSPYYFKPGEVDANSITIGADNMYEADFTNFGLEYKGTTIVFLTETSLRHYFKITDQGTFDLVKGSITFGSDEKIGYTEKNGEIYFELKNIAAADLDTLYTLTINGVPYKYSVLDYVKACLNSTQTSDKMKYLAAATYRYSQAANAYF